LIGQHQTTVLGVLAPSWGPQVELRHTARVFRTSPHVGGYHDSSRSHDCSSCHSRISIGVIRADANDPHAFRFAPGASGYSTSADRPQAADCERRTPPTTALSAKVRPAQRPRHWVTMRRPTKSPKKRRGGSQVPFVRNVDIYTRWAPERANCSAGASHGEGGLRLAACGSPTVAYHQPPGVGFGTLLSCSMRMPERAESRDQLARRVHKREQCARG
jgi:hypothetical protein